MATLISKTEDFKDLRRILNQSIDDLLVELENNGRKPPSLKPIDPQDLLAPPVGEKPRQSIVRVCEKLTTLVQGPIDVCIIIIFYFRSVSHSFYMLALELI